MLTKPMFRDPRLSRMAAFLRSIGIEMRAGAIDVPTLFPGSLISAGSLVVDESILVAPGDALHEAAHIALSPPERRLADIGLIEAATGGEELTTISWCWAALLELDLHEPLDVREPPPRRLQQLPQVVPTLAARQVLARCQHEPDRRREAQEPS